MNYEATEAETRIISVIVPARNEKHYIAGFIDSLLAQKMDGLQLEILIADGMSNDGTREFLQNFSRQDSRVRVIDNPARIVPTGLNAAIKQARGEIILRMDVHTEYAPDYIQRCVDVLQKTGADNVGGPAQTKANSYVQRLICLAYHSPFAVGGARFHNPRYEGFVDTVPYGCWQKETLLRVGCFDEQLVRNQDDELNLRITRSGGKIYQSASIQSWYYPRADLCALFRQYQQYGYWKVKVIQKHKIPASWRHLVPSIFVLSLIVSGILSLFWHPGIFALGGILTAYLLTGLLFAIRTAMQERDARLVLLLPFVFFIYHMSYGLGFLEGLFSFLLFHSTNEKNSRLTR